MSLAVQLAASERSTDLPIAAVIVDETGMVLTKSLNNVIGSGDITAHAEILALREIGLVPKLRKLAGRLTIAVTLEPCPMCAWAIRSAGIGSVIFGAYNPQYGAGGSVFDLLRDRRYGARIEVIGGIMENECSRLLADAYSKIRGY